MVRTIQRELDNIKGERITSATVTAYWTLTEGGGRGRAIELANILKARIAGMQTLPIAVRAEKAAGSNLPSTATVDITLTY